MPKKIKSQEELEMQVCIELAKQGIKLEDITKLFDKIAELIKPIIDLAEENYNYLQKIKK